MEKTDEKITLRFKIQFSISKLENAPEPIPVPNPITKKISTSRKNSYPGIHFSKKSKKSTLWMPNCKGGYKMDMAKCFF